MTAHKEFHSSKCFCINPITFCSMICLFKSTKEFECWPSLFSLFAESHPVHFDHPGYRHGGQPHLWPVQHCHHCHQDYWRQWQPPWIHHRHSRFQPEQHGGHSHITWPMDFLCYWFDRLPWSTNQNSQSCVINLADWSKGENRFGSFHQIGAISVPGKSYCIYKCTLELTVKYIFKVHSSILQIYLIEFRVYN